MSAIEFGISGKLLLVMALLFGLVGHLGARSVYAEEDAFDAMRTKWFDFLTGGTGYDTQDPDIAFKLNAVSQTSWASMDKSSGRTFLWSDMASTTNSSQITNAYGRLRGMALAYRTYGSSVYGDQALKADIVGALDWMYANRYNENKAEYDNWWDWEIGTPLQLNDIVTLMYDDLTSTQIQNYTNAVGHFSPDPTRVNKPFQFVSTGANRAWMCMVVGLRAVLIKSNTDLTAASDALDPLFDYVTSGDGFYEDGSFIQHNIYAYNGSYGASLLQQLVNVLYLLDGSDWEPTSSGLANVYQWVYDSYEPFIYKGAMMDMTRGRSISRNYETDHSVGQGIIASLVRLSQAAPTADAQRLKAMVKYWIQSDTTLNFFRSVDLSVAVQAKAIMADSGVVPRGELTGAKVFAGMDQAVTQRPGYAFGVSMSSSRIGTYEYTNNENLKGWYTGAGMTYLYNDDLQQYSSFWPTVNKYRLPGTTVDTRTRTDGEGGGYLSSKAWAGGSELLGQYAAAGMDYQDYGTTLTAKKSWFMFDDEIVALGAGINSTDGRTIETTVENRMLNVARTTQGTDLAAPAAAPVGSEPLRHKVYAVTDSGNDGNLPENTFDNNLGTRWSASGDGQWIQYDLGKTQQIGYVGISFYVQATRYTTFDIAVSADKNAWTTVYSGNSSVVSNDAIQVFDFPDVSARYVRIVGHGYTNNSANGGNTGPWNSIAEVQIYAPCSAGNLIIPAIVAPLNVESASDSLGSADLTAIQDGKIGTSWTASGDGQWLKLDLGSVKPVGYAGIAFPQGTDRRYTFDIEVSADNSVWNAVYATPYQSAPTTEVTAYDFPDANARYVKLVLHGNDVDLADAVSEVQLYSPSALGPVLDPLHTTRKVKGDEQLIVNGTAKSAALGWSESMGGVSYAYLEGTGGYYFPQPSNIKGARAVSEGSWKQLNIGGPDTTLSKNYVTLWLDHGANPVNEKYAYVLLPNKTASQTAAYSANPNTEILVNNPNTQAVKEKGLGIIGANFWAPSTFSFLTASNPSSLMLKDLSGTLDVGVSDPTHLQNKVTFEIHKSGLSVVSKDASVTVLQLAPTIKFEVDTSVKDGITHHVKFQYNPAVNVPLPTPTPDPTVTSATVKDDMNDYSNMYAHSPYLFFNTSNASYFAGDASRLARTANSNEYVVYKATSGMDLKQFTAKTWFWPYETIDDFQFYTSPDNTTYTPFTPGKTAPAGNWSEVDYSGTLPAGTQYLKIVFAHSTTNAWNPQIGSVELKSAVPAPTVANVTDTMNDFTKMFAHSAQLSFDSSNAATFGGDTSRLQRKTNTSEYVVYKAAAGMDLKQFAAKAWFWPYETAGDFQFYVSADNVTYAAFTPAKATVTGSWNKVDYSGTLPAGTQYLKIVFPITAAQTWNPQIGSVELESRAI
ncbi:polysaccharide lyase family 8 super-sandwich domain-containing protein [Cohnella sp. GCM10020058]|uniref:polysaccharide lyase family 8 super-sandwich domain-containing protein n=1 Tax=Cohnella sp. GCM10020058 TaxID=3317330 RepID=UPI003629F790